MIYGIGTDICDVRRIRASLEKHGERFAKKVLADGVRTADLMGPQGGTPVSTSEMGDKIVAALAEV